MPHKTPVPRNTENGKSKGGRTNIKVDWKEANFALQAGCTGADVAESLGCDRTTFYYQVEKKYKIKYQHHLQNLRRKGLNSLKMKQYQMAMKGNITMLIWLGKQYLGQKENPISLEVDYGKAGQYLDELKKLKTLEVNNDNVKYIEVDSDENEIKGHKDE